MIEVSVIIPVYNAQMFLEECIKSLMVQTLESCEFIFVNDGSKDESQLIIEKYQKLDSRIILINQENQGVSVARNNGISKAKGTYLGFVDADDYVSNDYFERLFEISKQINSDILVTNFNTVSKDTIFSNVPIFEVGKVYASSEIQQQLIPYFIKEDNLNPVWNKFYKADVIKKYGIHFPKGIVIGEDGLFNLQAFNFAKSIFFTDFSGYFYREIENSAVRDVQNKDYFKIALQQYHYDYKYQFGVQLETNEIEKLKSIRFINNIISLTNIYLNSNFSASQKKKYIKAMMKDEIVQKSIKKYWIEIKSNKSKYQQFILYCIKVKSFFLLELATKYSNFRNK